MGYPAVTSFLDRKRDPKEAALLAFASISRAMNDGNLLALLEREAEQVAALMEKAKKTEFWEGQYRMAEWRNTEAGKQARESILVGELRSKIAMLEAEPRGQQ